MSGLSSAEDYGALADADISDLTSDRINAEILRRLKNDDPSTDTLCVSGGGGEERFVEEHQAAYANHFAIEDARGIGVLGYYLGRCTHVRELWFTLPDGLPIDVIEPFLEELQNNRSIHRVYVQKSHIPRDFFLMLTPFIKTNPNLTEFCVQCELNVEQYRSLSTALREGKSLTHFAISGLGEGGRHDHEESIIATIEALKMHPQLESIAFYDFAMGRNACAALSDLLKISSGGMNKLNFLRNNVDDAGVEALVEGLAHCRGLKVLSLSGNRSVTIRGWGALAALLEDPNSNLLSLNLRDCDIGDDSATIFANALANNSTLERLYLNAYEEITGKGWEALSKVLCDTSSVNSTFLSNHTLQYLTSPGYEDEDDLPDELATLLTLNEEDDKKRVATEKILLHHDDFDMQPLFEWDLKVLPLVIEWLEMADAYGTGYAVLSEDEARISERKLAVVYKFIRGMPELSIEGVSEKKMKFAQTVGGKRPYAVACE